MYVSITKMPRNSHVKSEEMSKELLSYDLASDSEFVCGPRISFSCDFVLYDKESDFMEVNRNEYKADSPDFEFATPNCVELCPARVCMLPADELFHDGKLLPLQPISYGAKHDDRNIENLHQIVPTSNTDTFKEAFLSCELLQSLSITQTSSPVDDSSPPVSPKVPTCGARLGELFRSKKGQFHREQCSSLGGRQKTPWRLRRLFNQSRSVGSAEEMDKFCLRSDSLPVYSTPMHDGSANSFFSRLTSTDTSSLAVFDGKEVDDRYGDDQQPQPIIPPGKLFTFSQDHAEITSASRAGGNLDVQGSSTKSSVEKIPTKAVDNMFTRSIGRRTVERTGMSRSEYRTRSHSYSGKTQEQRKVPRQMDYARLPDKTISCSSSVRVTPVLNLPVCRGHSFRGVNVAKGRLDNLRHFFFRRKDLTREPSTAETDLLGRSTG